MPYANRLVQKEYQHQWYLSHRDLLIERNKEWRNSHPIETSVSKKRWADNHNVLVMKYKYNWKNNHPEKARCHYLLYKALSRGKISRPSYCSNCNSNGRPEGHHENYDNPLTVIWLCRKCHLNIHVTQLQQKAAEIQEKIRAEVRG